MAFRMQMITQMITLMIGLSCSVAAFGAGKTKDVDNALNSVLQEHKSQEHQFDSNYLESDRADAFVAPVVSVQNDAKSALLIIPVGDPIDSNAIRDDAPRLSDNLYGDQASIQVEADFDVERELKAASRPTRKMRRLN
jgi:hypothetical protein